MTDDKTWWHGALATFASQLTCGVLNEMKKRILTTKIKGEKLELNENTDRMKEFFQREIRRHQNRQRNLAKKLHDPETERLKQEVERLKKQLEEVKKLYLTNAHKIC